MEFINKHTPFPKDADKAYDWMVIRAGSVDPPSAFGEIRMIGDIYDSSGVIIRGGGSTVESLNELSDVTISAPSGDNVLSYDTISSEWVNTNVKLNNTNSMYGWMDNGITNGQQRTLAYKQGPGTEYEFGPIPGQDPASLLSSTASVTPQVLSNSVNPNQGEISFMNGLVHISDPINATSVRISKDSIFGVPNLSINTYQAGVTLAVRKHLKNGADLDGAAYFVINGAPVDGGSFLEFPISDVQQLAGSSFAFSDNIILDRFGACALNQLIDVNVPGPADKQVLTYDNGTSRWIASDVQAPISIIWRQGGTSTSPNVFTGDCAAMNAYISNHDELVEIVVDDSVNAPQIDDVLDCKFRIKFVGSRTAGADGSPYPIMYVTGNGFFLNAYNFDWILIQDDNTRTSPMFYSVLEAGNTQLMFENSRVQTFVDVSVFNVELGAPASGTQQIIFKQGSFDFANVTSDVLNIGFNCQCFLILSTVSANFNNPSKVFGGIGVFAGCFYDGNDVGFGSGNIPDEVQSDFTGGFQLSAFNVANRVSKIDGGGFVVAPSTVDAWLEKLKGGYIGTVDVPTPANGEVLTYVSGSGNWESVAPAGGALALQDLTNVNSSVDPADDAKFLRWDTVSNQWVDGFVRLKGKAVDQLTDAVQEGIYYDTVTRSISYYTGSQWRFVPYSVTDTSAVVYSGINAAFNPVVRWTPDNISGTPGALVWPASVGAGSISGQGVTLGTATIGGKTCVNCFPTTGASGDQWLQLDLGATYTGTSFTIAFMVQDINVAGGSNPRFIALLDDTPNVGNDFGNLQNAIGIFEASGNLSSFYNGGAVTWTTAKTASGSAPNPTVVVMRYTLGTNEWKMWMNSLTDQVVTTNTLTPNMGSLTLRTLAFGDTIPTHVQQGRIKVSEVLYWNNAQSDANISQLSNAMLVEYGVRPSGLSLGRAVAPTLTDDSSKGHGVGAKWMDTSSNREFICMNPAVGNAKWYQTSYLPALQALPLINSVMTYNGADWAATVPAPSITREFKWNYTIGGFDPSGGFFSTGGATFNSVLALKINKIDLSAITRTLYLDQICDTIKYLAIRGNNSQHVYRVTAKVDVTTFYQLTLVYDATKSFGSTTQTVGELYSFAPLGLDASPDVKLTAPVNTNTLTYNGTQWVNTPVIKNNYSATVAPAVGNDSSQGYSVGSRWINIVGLNEYVALNVALGVAVWKITT